MRKIVLSFFISTAVGWSVPTFSAESSNEGPEAVVAKVIKLEGKRLIPSWGTAQFDAKMGRYFTGEFLGAVRHGAKIAKEKHINIFDADFLTGAQMVVREVQFDSEVVGSSSNEAVVQTHVGTSDTKSSPKRPGVLYKYTLKKIGGQWFIDDILGSEQPSRKTLFLNPERYQ